MDAKYQVQYVNCTAIGTVSCRCCDENQRCMSHNTLKFLHTLTCSHTAYFRNTIDLVEKYYK